MQLLSRLSLLSLPLLSGVVFAQDGQGLDKKSYGYQSDVARLRKIVINSLYSHRDVFLRELISNSNDALEKLRITSLKESTPVENPLNITIKAVPNEAGRGGRLIITDYGMGMSAEDLATNLGTLAKSGTSDFLNEAETDSSAAGNLIGQFGVGFYSAFLVSDRVYVASIPAQSKQNPHPVQNVFSSSSDDAEFEVYPDPRGNTLGRGTEITLVLKDDASEYLNTDRLRDLVAKHSSFATSYPIYLQVVKTEEVPDEEAQAAQAAESASTIHIPTSPPESTQKKTDEDDDEGIVEDVVEDIEAQKEPEEPPVPMKNVTVQQWVHLNDQPPLWQRDPKNVTKEEYDLFYRTTYKESNDPLGVHHFKGDAGSISFKAMLFIPSDLEKEFWQSAKAISGGIKLMVKRVFITSDFGENGLPKWISWLRAIVDADDLPLNVSRETLQSTKFLAQMKQVIINRAISLLARISQEDPEQYAKILDTFGPAFKLGAVESQKDRFKLMSLIHWDTNLRNGTTLDEIVASKKKGQTQIFFHAGAGIAKETLAKSVFIEKLHARGYEVILAHDALDEILIANLRQWKGLQFQDVSKKGLVFGDEENSAEEEKAELEAFNEKFKPLIDYIKVQALDLVKDVIISNRLVESACAIVADQWGYSANMEKLMQAQTNPAAEKGGQNHMHSWARKQKALEINPRSPLIEGLLQKVLELEDAGEDKGEGLERDVKEVVSILIDGALVRSGFDVEDSNGFFTRIDRVLRRSLGVSESAATDTTVKPAPPVDDSGSQIDKDEMAKQLASELDRDAQLHDFSQAPPQFEDQIVFPDSPQPGPNDDVTPVEEEVDDVFNINLDERDVKGAPHDEL